MAYVSFDHVSKIYTMGETAIEALREVTFEANEGELTILLGASGAGKTTALNILGGMDRASSGRVCVAENEITKMNDRKLTQYRRTEIGFVFQFYNLVPNLTALENVELAVQVTDNHLDPEEMLDLVGLQDRKNNFPAQLSGGEQQRVSIARALAKNPKLLLCDEPTGALDEETGRQILKLIQDTSRERGMTAFIITHNSLIAPMADRLIRLRSGQVAEVSRNLTPTPVEQIEW